MCVTSYLFLLRNPKFATIKLKLVRSENFAENQIAIELNIENVRFLPIGNNMSLFG